MSVRCAGCTLKRKSAIRGVLCFLKPYGGAMIYRVVQNSVTVARGQFQHQGQCPFAKAPGPPRSPYTHTHTHSCLRTRHTFKFGCWDLDLTLTSLSSALGLIYPHIPLLHQRGGHDPDVLLHLFPPSLTLDSSLSWPSSYALRSGLVQLRSLNPLACYSTEE